MLEHLDLFQKVSINQVDEARVAVYVYLLWAIGHQLDAGHLIKIMLSIK